jgi:hypothetical protein
VVEINHSLPERQGREMSSDYKRTVEDFGGIPDHFLELESIKNNSRYGIMFGVFRKSDGYKQGHIVTNEKLYGYINFVREGDLCLYSQILGHGDYLNRGIMYNLHYHILEWLFSDDPMTDGVKYLMYGGHFDGGESLRKWKEKLHFTPAKLFLSRSAEGPGAQTCFISLFGSQKHFNDLKIGQRVKVIVTPDEDNTFVALEIDLDIDKNARENKAVIESLIQSSDHQKKTLHLLNREFALPGDIRIRDLQHSVISLKDLKVGDRVKLEGKYSTRQGFVPEKIKVKVGKGFNIGKLQGQIDKIDQEKKTLELVGFTVKINYI